MDATEFGTSIAAPMWAGVMALVNQQAKSQGLAPVGFANPSIYRIGKNPALYTAAFRDTVGQSNTNVCGFGYTTQSGYDLTTGWGTPRCGSGGRPRWRPTVHPGGRRGGRRARCSVRPDGSVRCWGRNDSGQLGVPATTAPSGPVTAGGLPALATKVVAGLAHTCARLADGTVACWGSNQEGQLGQGTFAASPAPVIVRGPAGTTGPLSGVIDIAAGSVHTCAFVVNQGVFCWGDNTFGQLGTQPTNPTNAQSALPLAVTGLQSSAIGVAAGALPLLRQASSPTRPSAWGDNDSGQLGVPSATANLQIAPPFMAAGVVSLAGTRGSTCVLLAGGGVKCAGDDTLLGIGVVDGLPHPAPVDVHGLGNFGLLQQRPPPRGRLGSHLRHPG